MLELGPDRHAARQPADPYSARLQHFADVVRSRFAFIGKVGCQHHFGHEAVAGARNQLLKMDLLRTDAVQRLQASHQHEVIPLECQGLLYHQLVRRRFGYAQKRGIASLVYAHLAYIVLCKRVAARTVADRIDGLAQRLPEKSRAVTVVLQHVVGNALRRLGTYPWQAPQCIGQNFKAGKRLH